ncbi:MAG: hypothetical protein HOV86_28950 [Thermoactinospora sp.]|nr:hypothetical protein [Thermoactinospora sp.]
MATEDDARALALALPETSERPMYGTPAFYVVKKWFARMHETPGVMVLPLAAEEHKHELVAADPGVFFTTAHYDGYAAVLVRLAEVGREELGELLADAWRLRAPKRLQR